MTSKGWWLLAGAIATVVLILSTRKRPPPPPDAIDGNLYEAFNVMTPRGPGPRSPGQAMLDGSSYLR
eukprot:jgi/Botrbrau1/14255/Bobra.113_2s0003.1